MKLSHLSPFGRTKHCLLGLTILLISLPTSVRATTTIVHVGAGGGLSFTPDPVFINVGDTVEWDWDFPGHSVTSGTPGAPDGMFDTGLQNAGFIFSFTFNSAGTMLASSPGQALYACDGSICTARGDRTLAAAGLQIFSDDRPLSGPYLSTGPTTDW